MKNKVFTAFLIVAAFAVGMMMSNGKQEAQASMDLSELYSQLDAMQDAIDNLDLVCETPCEVMDCTLPEVKVTEFVTLTEVVTMTEVVKEVVYRDRIITETVYIELPCDYDTPTCEEPEVEEPKSDTPRVEQPKDDTEEEPKVEQPSEPEVEQPKLDEPTPEVEEDTPQVEDTPKEKGKCNQGVGNGDEGCDPGNSNHNQPSNDEKTEDGKVPGSPGRQHNTNGNAEDKDTGKSDDKPKGKSEEVKTEKTDKEKGKKNS